MNELTCAYCHTTCAFGEGTEVATVQSNVARFAHQAFEVWRCAHCRSIHSRHAVDLESYYRDYPVADLKLDYFLLKAYAKRVRTLARHGIDAAARVLDFGCGGGQFITYLQGLGYARAEGHDPTVPRYAGREPLDRQYDCVVSYDVLEHVEDPGRMFGDLVERLAPGGVLVIGTPNAGEINLRRAADFRWHLHQPYHLHIASAQALRSLADKHGLEIAEWSRRPYIDTLWPGVNSRIISAYVDATGGCFDTLLKPDIGLALRSPRLLLYAFAGYWLRVPGNMTFVMRRHRG